MAYFDALFIISFSAVFTFIVSNRNYGKTWCFKKRAFRRAEKHGKKTIWVRRFKKEVKEASRTFYASADLQKFCGVEIYDAEKKTGNVKQVGNTFFIKYKNKWTWFLKIVALSDTNAMRSADDVDCDTIVFDEFTTTTEMYKRFHGNEVENFIDMFISAKRKHQVNCFFLGNKESINNPYFSYFGIKPFPATFEGVKRFKNGSIVVQQINNISEEKTSYDKKVKDLLTGTSYGDYLYESNYKQTKRIKRSKAPKDAKTYIQLNWNNNEIRILLKDAKFYISNKIDKLQPVYCDELKNKYKKEFQLIKKYKALLIDYINAVADNRIYYEDERSYENIQYFNKWLSI